jgi:molybdopterin synthase sulfur carrier subunit|tara:strand:- start:5018 stop:5269 length:252 start_codon:yes stop_codon:yes gene_type:complete
VIDLLFFGRLGDLAAEVDRSVTCVDGRATPLAIREWLATEHQSLAKELSEPQVLVSVNKMIVKWDQPLFDGDELAFLPPVTGG